MMPAVDFYLNDFMVEQPRPIELALFSSRSRRLESASFMCEQSSLAFGALAQAYEPGMIGERPLTDSFWRNIDAISNAADAAKNSNMLTDPAEERITEVLHEIGEALRLTKKSVADLQAKDMTMSMPFFHSEALIKLRGVSDFFAELARERKKVVFQPPEHGAKPWGEEMRHESKPY
jgi:hypothetical protein